MSKLTRRSFFRLPRLLLVLARGAGLLVIAERRSDQLVDRQAQLERALTQLNQRPIKDSLTGLANRAHFVTEVESSLARGERVSIAFLDLNDFKSVNDTLGHEAGDLLLVDLANRLASTIRAGDLVARFG